MEAKKEEKVYEVVHSLKITRGKQGVVLDRGEAVRASELSDADEIAALLKDGVIRDPELPDTNATRDAAHDGLMAIAQQLGLVTVKGTEYALGAKKAKGITAFRQAVSAAELHTAIVSACNTARNEAADLAEQLEAARAELAATKSAAK